MIEIPRAVLVADQIAAIAEFFSFGTNDLTQLTFGYSRDDAGKFLPIYVEKGILDADPFQTLDQSGTGQLVRPRHGKGQAGAQIPEGRYMRRTRRRSGLGGFLPRSGVGLRLLFSLPRSHRAPGGSPGGTCGEAPMSRIIAIANQKGGVGKTTTAVNLAASLAVAEQSTLLIDMDPQANATSGCGIEEPEVEKENIYHALLGHNPPEAVIRKTEISYLSVVPSHRDLAGAEVELVNMIAREQKLEGLLEELEDKYSYIIVDCPPSLGLLTINALTSADSVLIPIQCEYYALEGLGKLLNTIRLIQRHLNPKLQIAGVLLTMYDSRLRLARQVAAEVKSYFGNKVYKTAITRNVRLAEAPSHGQPILLYDIMSPGAQNYMRLAGEVINHG